MFRGLAITAPIVFIFWAGIYIWYTDRSCTWVEYGIIAAAVLLFIVACQKRPRWPQQRD